MTRPAAASTMPAMDRTLLQRILESTGAKESDKGYLLADEHRATIYLGRGGPANMLADLVRIALHDEHVEAEAKDRTLHFVEYEPILGLTVRRPREDVPRTGF